MVPKSRVGGPAGRELANRAISQDCTQLEHHFSLLAYFRISNESEGNGKENKQAINRNTIGPSPRIALNSNTIFQFWQNFDFLMNLKDMLRKMGKELTETPFGTNSGSWYQIASWRASRPQAGPPGHLPGYRPTR